MIVNAGLFPTDGLRSSFRTRYSKLNRGYIELKHTLEKADLWGETVIITSRIYLDNISDEPRVAKVGKEVLQDMVKRTEHMPNPTQWNFHPEERPKALPYPAFYYYLSIRASRVDTIIHETNLKKATATASLGPQYAKALRSYMTKMYQPDKLEDQLKIFFHPNALGIAKCLKETGRAWDRAQKDPCADIFKFAEHEVLTKDSIPNAEELGVDEPEPPTVHYADLRTLIANSAVAVALV